jgi:hypothetical protein
MKLRDGGIPERWWNSREMAELQHWDWKMRNKRENLAVMVEVNL